MALQALHRRERGLHPRDQLGSVDPSALPRTCGTEQVQPVVARRRTVADEVDGQGLQLVMTQVGALGRFATVSFDTDYAIGLVPSLGTIGLEETGPKDAAAPPNHASHALDWNGRFVHLELELARSTGSQFVATLKVDGVAVDAAVALAPNFALGKTATMVIGWGYVPGPSAPVAGFVDNLVVTLE